MGDFSNFTILNKESIHSNLVNIQFTVSTLQVCMVVFSNRFKAHGEGPKINRKNTISVQKLEFSKKKSKKCTELVEFSINGTMDQAHGLQVLCCLSGRTTYPLEPMLVIGIKILGNRKPLLLWYFIETTSKSGLEVVNLAELSK